MTIMPNSPAFLGFMEHLQEATNKCQRVAVNGAIHSDTYEVEDRQKFIVLWTIPTSNGVKGTTGKSCFAFVAKEDGESKALGVWHKGDVFKPASCKAPAKGTRGNVYSLHKGMEATDTAYGMVHVRSLR